MRCLIVDDDEFSRLVIRKCVERHGSLRLVAECESAADASRVLKDNEVDLIFLDIEMPEMTGLEFIQSLKTVPHIILITSKEEYAVEAFELDAVDYIVKPLEYGRFLKAISKVNKVATSIQYNKPGDDHIFIKKDSKLVRVKLTDVQYIEALADYVNIYTEDTRFTVLSTMKAMETKLPSDLFTRVHRSFIVSLPRITAIEENVIFIGDKSIPVSRSFKESLMNRLNLF